MITFSHIFTELNAIDEKVFRKLAATGTRAITMEALILTTRHMFCRILQYLSYLVYFIFICACAVRSMVQSMGQFRVHGPGFGLAISIIFFRKALVIIVLSITIKS